MDQVVRGFWWGHEPCVKKLHLRNWEDLCQSKSIRGLGIRKTKNINRALLGKQAWRIISEPKSLMTSTRLPKYYRKRPFIDTEPKLGDSLDLEKPPLWKRSVLKRH